jgi:hypothetical protein
MKKYVIILFIGLIVFYSCKKDDYVKKERINGFVQKGPFINGTSISMYELNSNFLQTGKSFNTYIINSIGSFEFGNIELATNYVSFRADGFYYNEINNEQSSSQITLSSLSDIADKTTVNINILTHLEKARVEFLIYKGLTFHQAKIQAQSEVLNIFSINKALNEASEILNISQEGENNAVLLAVSLILQGYRSVGELTELLSNISNDIKEDGVLNSSSLGSQLINHAVSLNTNTIRNNLETRYAHLGVNVDIPDFEKYIKIFIDNTAFTVSESVIKYPAIGLHGDNILDLNTVNYSGENFSLAASLPKGAKLKIKITALGDGVWVYAINSSTNWNITQFDFETKSQYFTAIESGTSCDLNIKLHSGQFLIEYFEMGLSEPFRKKIINKL